MYNRVEDSAFKHSHMRLGVCVWKRALIHSKTVLINHLPHASIRIRQFYATIIKENECNFRRNKGMGADCCASSTPRMKRITSSVECEVSGIEMLPNDSCGGVHTSHE